MQRKVRRLIGRKNMVPFALLYRTKEHPKLNGHDIHHRVDMHHGKVTWNHGRLPYILPSHIAPATIFKKHIRPEFYSLASFNSTGWMLKSCVVKFVLCCDWSTLSSSKPSLQNLGVVLCPLRSFSWPAQHTPPQ